MSSISTETRTPVAATLQHFFWLHPDWWSVALCGSAWAVMLLRGWQHAGHEVHHRMPFAQELEHWLLMVAAMMLPLSLDAVRVTAEGSLWARRHRAIAGFLLGYFGPWLALGIVAAGLREASWTHTYAAAALGFACAAVWLRTPMHTRALIACHRRLPLAPVGWQADRDCLRFGAAIGVACVWSCWPLMLACAFAGHGLIAIAGGMAVGAMERWSFRPRRRAALAGTLAIAGCYLLLAVSNGGAGFGEAGIASKSAAPMQPPPLKAPF
jgi:predicted metal-binding membrane protein